MQISPTCRCLRFSWFKYCRTLQKCKCLRKPKMFDYKHPSAHLTFLDSTQERNLMKQSILLMSFKLLKSQETISCHKWCLDIFECGAALYSMGWVFFNLSNLGLKFLLFLILLLTVSQGSHCLLSFVHNLNLEKYKALWVALRESTGMSLMWRVSTWERLEGKST